MVSVVWLLRKWLTQISSKQWPNRHVILTYQIKVIVLPIWSQNKVSDLRELTKLASPTLSKVSTFSYAPTQHHDNLESPNFQISSLSFVIDLNTANFMWWKPMICMTWNQNQSRCGWGLKIGNYVFQLSQEIGKRNMYNGQHVVVVVVACSPGSPPYQNEPILCTLRRTMG